MTPDDFRRLVLALEGAEESAHMGHPDFRLGGKIFATLGYPDGGWAMVRLPPEQQQLFVEAHPGLFAPVKGAWGMQGATTIQLGDAAPEVVETALRAAWLHRQAPPQRRSARA
jgi:hypothetical protein